jgi:hypothetical protein
MNTTNRGRNSLRSLAEQLEIRRINQSDPRPLYYIVLVFWCSRFYGSRGLDRHQNAHTIATLSTFLEVPITILVGRSSRSTVVSITV